MGILKNLFFEQNRDKFLTVLTAQNPTFSVVSYRPLSYLIGFTFSVVSNHPLIGHLIGRVGSLFDCKSLQKCVLRIF